MVLAFDELGVKVEHLEKRLGHNLDATIPQEIVTLKGIYKSIKDGMATREDFFEIASTKILDAKEEIKTLIAKNKQKSGLNSKETENKLQVDPETGEVLPEELQA